MHNVTEASSSGVPAFLAKLWRLVEDSKTDNMISWSADGKKFLIRNQAQFAKEILPLNYKHNNMASFIRQLNMYGFHKITSIDNGGLKFDRDEMEFSHPCFKREHPYLLENIKRKIANQKTTDEKSLLKSDAAHKVLNEVRVMRGRQDYLDSRFGNMKRENAALWREIAEIRQKHLKQQQIVNKLIQFLVTIVQPSGSSTLSGIAAMKRPQQLMIDDSPKLAKLRKRNEHRCGPIIQELSDDLLEEALDIERTLLSEDRTESPVAQVDNDLIMEINADEDDSGVDYVQSDSPLSQQHDVDIDNDDMLTFDCTGDDVLNELAKTSNATFIETNIKKDTPPQNHNSSHQLALYNAKLAAKGMLKPADSQKINQKINSYSDTLCLSKNGKAPYSTRKFIKPTATLTRPPSNVATKPERSTVVPHSFTEKEDFISNEMPHDIFDETLQIIQMANEVEPEPEPSTSQQSVAADQSNRTNSDNANGVGDADISSNSAANTNVNKSTDLARLTTMYGSDYDTHLDNVQGELDSLKDLLRNEGYNSYVSNLLSGSISRATPLPLILHGIQNVPGKPKTNRSLSLNRSPSPSISIDGHELFAQLFGDNDILPGLTMEEPQNPNNLDKDNAYTDNCHVDLTALLDASDSTIQDDTLIEFDMHDENSKGLDTPVIEEKQKIFRRK